MDKTQTIQLKVDGTLLDVHVHNIYQVINEGMDKKTSFNYSSTAHLHHFLKRIIITNGGSSSWMRVRPVNKVISGMKICC